MAQAVGAQSYSNKAIWILGLWRAFLASNHLNWPRVPIAVYGPDEPTTYALVVHCHGNLIQPFFVLLIGNVDRSEERRVGKEC